MLLHDLSLMQLTPHTKEMKYHMPRHYDYVRALFSFLFSGKDGMSMK